MTFERSERKCLEILRILKEHHDPIGAKRLSEMMSERGFVLSDRAVQYYLSYLDDLGFTKKEGNKGRVLTEMGLAETDSALVEERIGYVISKLERLAYRSTFNPETDTGNVAYNLSIVPDEEEEKVRNAFDQVIKNELGFFSSYMVTNNDPRIPDGEVGFITLCSVTMDGVLLHRGVPVKIAYGGTLELKNNKPASFRSLIGYKGTTEDPLSLFISAGLTSVGKICKTGTGMALANIRYVPRSAEGIVSETASMMRNCGFLFPVAMGVEIFNFTPDQYHTSVVSYSGMNTIANAIEQGCSIRTEIGAGNIQFSKVIE